MPFNIALCTKYAQCYPCTTDADCEGQFPGTGWVCARNDGDCGMDDTTCAFRSDCNGREPFRLKARGKIEDILLGRISGEE